MELTYNNPNDEESFLCKSTKDFPKRFSEGIGNYFLTAMKKYGDRVSQIDATTGRKETFNEIRIQTIRIALELKNRGTNENDVISICSSLSNDVFKPLIASFLIGAKTATLDPTLSLNHTAYLLEIVKPKMIFCSSKAIDLIENALKKANLNSEIISFEDSLIYASYNDFLKPHVNENEFVAKQPENDKDTALMLFSSGTTGQPKAICLSHYGFLSQSGKIDNETIIQNVKLNYSSPYWISFLMLLTTAFGNGHIRIIPKPFDEHNLMVTIQKYQVSHCMLTPNHIHRIVTEFYGKIIPYDISSLECIFYGGSPIFKDHLLKLKEMLPNVDLINLYGMTESSGLITKFVPSKDKDLMKHKIESCGRVTNGVTIKIIDENGINLPLNSKGEVCIKTKYLMNGYLTKDGFNSDFLDDKGWYRTGDIGYLDDDFCLYIVDRNKQMLKYHGYQISPADIEQVLLMHPMILNAVVFGKPDPCDGDHPTAAVVLKENAKVTEQEIIDFVNEQIDEQRKIRGGVYFVDDIPLTPSGKYKKNELRDFLLNQEKK